MTFLTEVLKLHRALASLIRAFFRKLVAALARVTLGVVTTASAAASCGLDLRLRKFMVQVPCALAWSSLVGGVGGWLTAATVAGCCSCG